MPADITHDQARSRTFVAAEQNTNKVGVFAASAGALVLSSRLAVLVGSQLSAYIPPRALKLAAGIGFTILA